MVTGWHGRYGDNKKKISAFVGNKSQLPERTVTVIIPQVGSSYSQFGMKK
jgi:hypothetical protein